MSERKKENLRFWMVVVIMFFAIIATRAVALTHNISLHPDERVFAESSAWLRDFLLGKTDGFIWSQPYPEGAFVLQGLFSFAFNPLFDGTDYRVVIRVFSVLCYCIGCMFGCLIIYDYLSKSIKSVVIFAISATFSLFYIEQSRYGTGDPITFSLIMLMLFLTSKALEKKNEGFVTMWFACLTAGVLCAVKYPLITLGFIPAGATLLSVKKKRIHIKLAIVFAMIVAFIIGFAAFSPKAVDRPWYLAEVYYAESDSYIRIGNNDEVGGVVNHFLEVVVYWLFYSDFPLAPIFIFFSIVVLLQKKEKTSVEMLFTFIVPSVMLFFLVYNLFTTTLFMRTYCPLFALGLIYSSFGISICLKDSHVKPAVVLLCFLLVIRGAMLCAAMINDDYKERYKALLNDVDCESVDKEALCSYSYWISVPDFDWSTPGENRVYLSDYFDNGTPKVVEKGSLIVTDCLEFFRCQPYFVRIDNEEISSDIFRWQEFKKNNQEYLKGKLYPDWYYYLFGYWIKGTTAAMYEFPTNYIYYNPK